MKKILLALITVILFSGCSLATYNMENIIIYTTTYPIEYITTVLYGENSRVFSVYPNEITDLSDKLLTDYSEGDLFVYNGLDKEKDYAVAMLNKNKNLMIVDAAMGMEYTYDIEELWLNPSNFLMLCQNIKNGMKEYISNSYLRKEIDEKYDELKLKISEMDADIKLTAENAVDKNIIVSNDVLLFLEKYKLNIVSLDKDTVTEKKISDAKDLIDDKKINYIIMISGDKVTDEVEKMLEDNSIEKIYLHSLTTISEEEENNNEDYITIMNKNIESLKKELYE